MNRWKFSTPGIFLLIVLVLTGFIVGCLPFYSTHDLKVSDERFGSLHTRSKADSVARHLVSLMTLDEKIDQLYGAPFLPGLLKLGFNYLLFKRFAHIYVGENERLGIPPFVLSDGPRGVRVMRKGTNGVTTFPVAMARGASWDTDLEYRINDVIAREMRANGVNYAATPCINLLRHPAWGRAQETYGEDPWLLGEMGLAAVKAYPPHHVMACPKHFVLNSIENSRFVVDVGIRERTLREVYLPHFKKVVREGEVPTLMTSYNQVRGRYMAENAYLNRQILRKEWGFDGFLTSDWFFGAYDGPRSIQGGLNVEMPLQQAYDHKDLKAALEEGIIAEEQIDELVVQTLRTRLPFAVAEDHMEYPPELIASETHTRLAREAAEKSMVLLKNEEILPFSASDQPQVAVIGKLANQKTTGDRGSSNARPTYVVSALEGIRKYITQKGGTVKYVDGTKLTEARELAEGSDQVIVVVGFTYRDEGEYTASREKMLESAERGQLIGGKKKHGGDRLTLRLRPEDLRLLEVLKASNPNLVVVYSGGSAITMETWIDDVPALLFSWYAGMEGGNALANILYGEANPSGKLPFTIGKYEEDYPPFTPFTKAIDYGYYHGYTLFEKDSLPVRYPFGYGLSYTDYQYDSLKVNTDSVGTINVSVEVTNTGEAAGEEVVQLYIGFSQSSVDRPVKLLRGFDKVRLAPGQSKSVDFLVAPEDLAWYNPQTMQWEVEDMTYEVYAGPSSAHEQLLKKEVRIMVPKTDFH